MKVDVLLPSSSQYGVIHHFTQKLNEAFQRQGCSTRLLEGNDRVEVPLNSPPDLTVCFNGAPSLPSGDWLADHIKVPHLNWLLDPPYRFWEELDSQWIWLGCDDLFGCEMLRRMSFTRQLFLPHAVEREFHGDARTDRPYTVTMLATYIDSDARRKQWRKRFGTALSRAMNEAVEESLEHASQSFIEVLWKHLQKHPSEHISELLRREIFEEFELCIKGIERTEMVRLFADRGVHVFGGSLDKGSWQSKFKGISGVTVHPAVSYEEALNIMRQTKILLNSSLKNRAGAHERLFSGIAGGALVVTNGNPFLEKEFGNSLLTYQWKTRGDLPAAAQALLDNDDLRYEKVMQAQQIVAAHHTFDHRVATILKTIVNKST